MVRTVGESLRALLLICVVSFFVKLAADFVLFGRMHADLRWYANASITAAVLALVYFWSRYRLRAAYARLLAYEDGRRVRNHAIRNHLNVIACLVP
jgi:hypothetical protein